MKDELSDEMLDGAILRARSNYHVPPASPPLDEIWKAVDEAVFSDTPRRTDELARGRWPSTTRRGWAWPGAISGIAAALVIGFALGRTSAPAVAAGPVAATAPSRSVAADAAYDRTATVLLGETAVLLSALPETGGSEVPDRRFVAQAVDLLVTTRLLLDSQASSDSRLRELLEDLELVLAQIARIDKGKSGTDLELITEALTERDIVPRIRRVAAGLASTDN